MESAADAYRSSVTRVYNEIRAKLNERESMLKRRVADQLEEELSEWKAKIREVEEQVQWIGVMREECAGMDLEEEIETIRRAKYRGEVEIEATRKIEIGAFKQVFNEFNRLEEIGQVIKILQPQ